MPIWEYKLITSGKGGFASPQLLEQHLNQLGKEEWEIVEFRTPPDNPLAFHGLARRPITRDWFPKPEETKPAYLPPPIPPEAATEEDDDRDERSFADELPPPRPANAPPPAQMHLGNFDDLADDEDEHDLPTLFEALRPYLRKSSRGDLSVGLEFIAKKFEQAERDLLAAFAECGLKAPGGAGEKGEVVGHGGWLYWLERDKRGRVWVNTSENRQEKKRESFLSAGASTKAERRDESGHEAAPTKESGPKTLLGRIRALMRRNRRGQGWSGSFSYLTKALEMDEAQLLGALAGQGLRLPADGGEKPTFAEDGGFVFWLNKNQRGETWINARKESETKSQKTEASASMAVGTTAATAMPAPENTLAAVRLLLRPKKHGTGVAALVGVVAEQLHRSREELLQALAVAGLNVPATAKDKPTFGEHGGEIFWLNQNAKGQLWLNAKTRPASKAREKRPQAGEA